jgi:hypothetical protein
VHDGVSEQAADNIVRLKGPDGDLVLYGTLWGEHWQSLLTNVTQQQADDVMRAIVMIKTNRLGS